MTIPINTGKCRELIAWEFPDFDVFSVRYLAEGWDSTAFLVNDAFVFRFPMRDSVDRSLQKEISLLPLLRDRLPLQIPDLQFVGRPGERFPWHFVGYPLIAGNSLGEASSDRLIPELAQQIAAFLRSLHDVPLSDVLDIGLRHFEPAHWWENKRELFRDTSAMLEQELDQSTYVAFKDEWEQFLANASEISFCPTLIHGDLAMEHIIVSEHVGTIGVIDFGDATIADPALDFAGFSSRFVSDVLENYTDDAQIRNAILLRRRLYKASVPMHAVKAGIEFDRPELIEIGVKSIRNRYRL